MKKRALVITIILSMASAALWGCGENGAPEEVTSSSTQEASVAEAVVEASTEASVEETKEAARPTSLDDALAYAILDHYKLVFMDGEAAGEGHILMDKEGDDSKGEQKCYVLSMFGTYEFQNGNFVKSAGTGVIPCVITVELKDDGEYYFVSYDEAEDGSSFVSSIKEMFPEKLWSRCITIDDDDRNELVKQERSYMEEYLGTIGREDVEVGDYADFEYVLLTDLGVSVDVSNALLDVESGEGFEKNCPMWVGDREVIEEDVRYTYKKEYDEKKDVVIYSKIKADTGDVLESSTYDAKTGKKVEK